MPFVQLVWQGFLVLLFCTDAESDVFESSILSCPATVIEIVYFFPQYYDFVLCVFWDININWIHVDSYIFLMNWCFHCNTHLFYLQRCFPLKFILFDTTACISTGLFTGRILLTLNNWSVTFLITIADIVKSDNWMTVLHVHGSFIHSNHAM